MARADLSHGLPVGVDGEVAIRPQLAAESHREGRGTPKRRCERNEGVTWSGEEKREGKKDDGRCSAPSKRKGRKGLDTSSLSKTFFKDLSGTKKCPSRCLKRKTLKHTLGP